MNGKERFLAILFRKDLFLSSTSTYEDEDGNLLAVSLTVNGINLTLITLYGPNYDSPIFYDNLEQFCGRNDDLKVICGDWNLVINPDFDYDNY